MIAFTILPKIILMILTCSWNMLFPSKALILRSSIWGGEIIARISFLIGFYFVFLRHHVVTTFALNALRNGLGKESAHVQIAAMKSHARLQANPVLILPLLLP